MAFLLGFAYQASLLGAPLKQEVVQTHTTSQDRVQPPFNVADLWEKLKQLMRISGKDISRERIEEIFNINLPIITDKPTEAGYVIVQATNYWNYRLGFSLQKPLAAVSFNFEPMNETVDSMSDDLCLNKDMVTKDLVEMGWSKALGPSPDPSSTKSTLPIDNPPPAIRPNITLFFRQTNSDITERLSLRINSYHSNFDYYPYCVTHINLN